MQRNASDTGPVTNDSYLRRFATTSTWVDDQQVHQSDTSPWPLPTRDHHCCPGFLTKRVQAPYTPIVRLFQNAMVSHAKHASKPAESEAMPLHCSPLQLHLLASWIFSPTLTIRTGSTRTGSSPCPSLPNLSANARLGSHEPLRWTHALTSMVVMEGRE